MFFTIFCCTRLLNISFSKLSVVKYLPSSRLVCFSVAHIFNRVCLGLFILPPPPLFLFPDFCCILFVSNVFFLNPVCLIFFAFCLVLDPGERPWWCGRCRGWRPCWAPCPGRSWPQHTPGRGRSSSHHHKNSQFYP